MRISAVIPCYNEEASIANVITLIPKEVSEIIIVDNNSRDRTAEIARSLNARVIPEPHQGYGSALKTGFRAAEGDIIATLDGDCQYPPELITSIVTYLETNNLDFISASRFPLDEAGVMNRTRQIGNYLFTLATNLLFGLQLKDSQSGMWIFRKKILDYFTLESDDMPLSQELKIRAAKNPNIRFAEYHIPYRPRIGSSKLFPLKHGLINLWFLIRLRFTL